MSSQATHAFRLTPQARRSQPATGVQPRVTSGVSSRPDATDARAVIRFPDAADRCCQRFPSAAPARLAPPLRLGPAGPLHRWDRTPGTGGGVLALGSRPDGRVSDAPE